MSVPADLNLVGVIGDIPAASAAYNGKLYFATDEDGGTLYRCNGASWVKVAAAAGLAGPGTPTLTSLYCQAMLYDNVLSGSGTWDVSTIDQTYDHLRIIAKLRGVVAATGVGFLLTFNNDTTDANYLRRRITGNLDTIVIAEAASRQFMAGPAASAAAGFFAYIYVDIPLYSGNAYKEMQYNGVDYRGSAGGETRAVISGHTCWLSTAAINRIAVVADNATNTLAIGSRLQIIGMKAMDVVTAIS